nr:MAG TPA: hypothetical protein [Caudoviricetes sp.]
MTLKTVIDKLKQLQNKLIDKETLDGWLFENINITNYISIGNKYAYIHKINEIFSEEIAEILNNKLDIELVFMRYDMHVLFDILLKYTDIEVAKDDKSPEYYDIMVETEFDRYLKLAIGNDCAKFVDAFEKASGINEINTMNIIKGAIDNNITQDKIDALDKVFKKLSTKKNKDFLEDVMAYSNPAVKELMDGMRKSAMEDANKKLKEKYNKPEVMANGEANS